jgi:Ca2+-binding EF-hand superfamily protein
MTPSRRTFAAAVALVGATALAAGAYPKGKAFTEARDAAFAEADADRSGSLTADEFATFHEAMKSKLAAARFARMDVDGDGQITADELANAKRGSCHGKDKPDAD